MKTNKVNELMKFIQGSKAFADQYDLNTKTLTYYDDRGQKQIIENISPEHAKMLKDLENEYETD